MIFDEDDDDKYHCCCRSIHVVLGTQIWLGLYILGSFINLIIYFPIFFVCIWIPIIVVICTIFAFVKKNPALLWPFIIVQAITVVLCILGLICTVVLGLFLRQSFIEAIKKQPNAGGDIDLDREPGVYWAVFGVIVTVLVLSVLVGVWELRVLWQCKTFYEALRMASHSIQPPQQYAIPQYVDQSHPPPNYQPPGDYKF